MASTVGSTPVVERARRRLDRRVVRAWRRTVVQYAITLLAVVTLVFLLPRAMPGDPIAALEDPDSGQFLTDPEVRQRVLAHYGLDGPLHVQYVRHLRDVAQLDLGWSISRSAPVTRLLAQHLPWTLLLSGLALGMAGAVSWLAGITSAWRRGRLDDRLLVTLFTGARAVPEYAIASLLLLSFAVLAPVFPLYGARTAFADHPSFLVAVLDIAHHLALPLLALTLGLLGSTYLLVRNTVIGALGQDYMVAARAKGLPVRLQKHRHAGRNAVLPFLTVFGIQCAMAIGGSIFVESVFTYPGMGVLVLDAVSARDYPVLEAAFLVLSVAVLAVNLVVDLVYVRIDPRVTA